MEPYPKGTKLEDVPPEFRGMRLREWLAECRAFERTRAEKYVATFYRPLSDRRWFKKGFPSTPAARLAADKITR